jgi:hypothetical protein
MRVPKPLAIFGFHFCTTVFIGLSAYGVIRYMSEGLIVSDSLASSAFYASLVLASITGICLFGREADRRKREEIAANIPAAPPKPAKRKKSKA